MVLQSIDYDRRAGKSTMVLRTPFGSGTGAAAQHSQCLEALFLIHLDLKLLCLQLLMMQKAY